jgi:hypothetical protein
MVAQVNQKIHGSFYADGAPLILAIVNENNYTRGESINSTKCLYYIFDIEETFNVLVPKEGIWYLVLLNPGRSTSYYEYFWSIRNTMDLVIESIYWISIPTSILILIVLIKKSKNH